MCFCICGCQNRLDKLDPDGEVASVVRLYPQLEAQNKYFVGGRITTSRTYRLSSGERQTVTGAIMKAGGFAQFANKKEVLHGRKDRRGKIRVTAVDVGAICRGIVDFSFKSPADFNRKIRESGGQLPGPVNEKDPHVMPGDVIVVKQYHIEGGWETVMDVLKNRNVSARCRFQ